MVRGTQSFLYRFSRALVRLYAFAMLRVDIVREVPLPAEPVLIAANHPSTSDAFYIAIPFRCPVRLVMVESPFRIPIFGAFLRASGHIAVRPEDKQAALQEALRELTSGNSVVIFPEGDTSPRQGGFLPPRAGAAQLALSARVPVIPVGIHLNRDACVTLRSKATGRPTVGYWHLRGPYGMTIGRPLEFSGGVEDREHVRAVSAKIMEEIIRLANASHRRLDTSGTNA